MKQTHGKDIVEAALRIGQRGDFGGSDIDVRIRPVQFLYSDSAVITTADVKTLIEIVFDDTAQSTTGIQGAFAGGQKRIDVADRIDVQVLKLTDIGAELLPTLIPVMPGIGLSEYFSQGVALSRADGSK